MNLYIDTSALIKLHIQENYSDEVRDAVKRADAIATNLNTRAEAAAGINRLLRMMAIDQAQCTAALANFRREWVDYHRLPITEEIVAHADMLTCQYQLRGYDAVHLACALKWQDLLGAPVSLATFDKELMDAAQNLGLEILFA